MKQEPNLTLEKYTTNKHLYCFIIISSLLTSWSAIYFDSIINSDAAIYLAAAETYNIHGLEAAKNIYPKVFLPFLIGGFSELLNTSILTSSYILMSTFFCLTGIGFLRLIEVLNGSQSAKIIATLTILLLPSINSYKDYIFRDSGFWAFSLFSLTHLIRYTSERKISQIALWLTAQIIASLFRTEGLVFLALTPIFLLLTSGGGFREKLITLTKIGLTITITLALTLLINQFIDIKPIIDGMFQVVNSNIQNLFSLIENYDKLSQKLSVEILNVHAKDKAYISLLFSLLPIMIAAIINALTWPIFLCISYFGIKKILHPQRNSAHIFYTLTASLILFIFIIEKQFLQSRYTILLALLLLPSFIFSLEDLIKNTNRKKAVVICSTLAILTGFIDSYIGFGHSKKYLPNAIAWIEDNTPEDTCMLSNQRAISYSVDRRKEIGLILKANGNTNKKFIREIEKKCSFYILHVDHDKIEKENAFNSIKLNYNAIKVFRNKRNDRAIIYENQLKSIRSEKNNLNS